jgi:hypothetical protein
MNVLAVQVVLLFCFIHNTILFVSPDLCFRIAFTLLCISVPTHIADVTQGKPKGNLFLMPKAFPIMYSNLSNAKHMSLIKRVAQVQLSSSMFRGTNDCPFL